MSRVRRPKIVPGNATRIACSPARLIKFLVKAEIDPAKTWRGTPCWNWKAWRDDNGYGRVKINGRHYWVHRAAYAIFVRSIPAGREIDHRCNNPSCFNPKHLRCRCPLLNAADGGRHRHKKYADEIPF